MRVSCNGCRVLRKGCGDTCIIRPCLQWIKSPDSQANATLFLAKFYGRAGLLNLINAGPQHLHPAIFKSLLYEACGRIVNPVYGSAGMLWSGNWSQCQAAVDAVLKGSQSMIIDGSKTLPVPNNNGQLVMSSQDNINNNINNNNISFDASASDIRHVSKETKTRDHVFKVKTTGRFKRPAATATKQKNKAGINYNHGMGLDLARSSSNNSMSRDEFGLRFNVKAIHNGSSSENGSVFSVETVEVCLAKQDKSTTTKNEHEDNVNVGKGDRDEVGLELSLGFVTGSTYPNKTCKNGKLVGEREIPFEIIKRNQY